MSQAGWTPTAAETVVALNADWFQILQQNSPQLLEKQRYLLQNLGKHPQWMPWIEKHPETASLLVLADTPTRFTKSLINDECYDVITGLFVQHAARDEAIALAQALEKNRNLICRLARRGLIGSQALFLFPRNNPGAAEYERWLAEVLNDTLGQSEEQLSSLLNFLFEQGASLRSQMIDKESFRYTFRQELWPKFMRVVNHGQQPLEFYVNDSHLWDLLALPQGEALLNKWGAKSGLGYSPADVLFGNEAYPKSLHLAFIDAVLNDDENTLVALLEWGRTPLFQQLFFRLPADLTPKLYEGLANAGANYPSELEYYASLSDSALNDELNPKSGGLLSNVPGYDALSVIGKFAQGRRVTGGDLAFATADMGDLAVTIFTFGAATALTSSAKTVAKSAAKAAVKTTARQLMEKKLGQKVAEKASEQSLHSWVKHDLFTKLQQFAKAHVVEPQNFNITPVTQFLFKKASPVLNRQSFKAVGLEPRLFMRRDATVVIRFQQSHLKDSLQLVSQFFANSANQATGAELEQLGEEAESMVVTGFRPPDQTAWQKNISAWWLMNASGME